MNKLIFAVIFLPFAAFAQGQLEKPEILSDQELSKKMVSHIKDAEVEKKLSSSTEFADCMKDVKFDPNADQAAQNAKALEAETCFRKKLEGKQDKEALKKLSESMSLDSFQLVNTKDNKAIVDYFGDKIYKALTGVDRKAEKEKSMMKFENRKNIDQKTFFELYKNHISKTALFEISRYCFENVRQYDGSKEVPPGGKTFEEYWTGHDIVEAKVTDTGTGTGTNGFGALDVSDTDKAFQSMLSGITKNSANGAVLGKFFTACFTVIDPLCKSFKTSVGNNSALADSTAVQRGAASCITQSRLAATRKALADTKKTLELFNDPKAFAGGVAVGYDKGRSGEFYKPTAGNDIDTIATVSSTDFLEGGRQKDSKEEKIAKECAASPEAPDCDKFLIIDDSLAKAEFATNLQYRAKKETELARLRAIKDNDKKSLETYLEENGYLDLLDKVKKGENVDIEREVGAAFDAKRIAAISNIQQKMGSRQIRESDTRDKGLLKKASAKEQSEERARMAQVVMFNNIVLAYVDAYTQDKQGKKKEMRYDGGLKAEVNALEKQSKVDGNLFAGFKQGLSGGSNSPSSGIEELDFLDSILGAPAK